MQSEIIIYTCVRSGIRLMYVENIWLIGWLVLLVLSMFLTQTADITHNNKCNQYY